MGPATDNRAQLLALGREQAPLIVIDDCIADPGGLIERAAAQTFKPISGHLYPGVRAQAPDSYISDVVPRLRDLIMQVFGFGGHELVGIESDFSIVTTPPDRLATLQRLPHFDTNKLTQIAVLHYLCGPEFGGTAFYRHVGTGFEIVDAARRDTYLQQLGGELQASGPPPERYIAGDTPLFELIHSVEAKPNRLIVYRSASLHSGSIPAGAKLREDARTGRLTVNTFLHFALAKPKPAPAPWFTGV